MPPGLAYVLLARGTGKLVAHLPHDRRVRVVSFAGSTQAGRVSLRSVSDQVPEPAMGFGGNARLFVFEDADLDAAVASAMVTRRVISARRHQAVRSRPHVIATGNSEANPAGSQAAVPASPAPSPEAESAQYHCVHHAAQDHAIERPMDRPGRRHRHAARARRFGHPRRRPQGLARRRGEGRQPRRARRTGRCVRRRGAARCSPPSLARPRSRSRA